ncbi:hypothetical protein ABFY09_12835 [Marinomonas sp. 5E14-1]|uniref:hypothetical protein n=1 Tax=Marinomonas sp. 5E14-1 TaxID=3153922 RepID=UPI003265AC0E
MYQILKTRSESTFRKYSNNENKPAVLSCSRSVWRFPLIVNLEFSTEFRVHKEANEFLNYLAVTVNNDLTRKKYIVDASLSVCIWLNFIYYFDNTEYSQRSEWNVSSSVLMRFRVYLQSIGNLSDSRVEEYVMWAHRFYWYLDHIRFEGGSGIIGVNKPEKKQMYPIYVHPGKGTWPFLIPNTPSILKEAKPAKTFWDDWCFAIETAAGSNNPIGTRDALMMELIQTFSIRREELITMEIDAFSERAPSSSEITEMQIQLSKSKNDRRKGTVGRIVNGPKEVYIRVQKFIKTSRKLFIKSGVKDRAVFLSKRSGKRFIGTSLSAELQRKYGVSPQDGRKVSATQLFINYLDQGLQEKTAMLLVAEHLGHSKKTEGKTLQASYLQAMVIRDIRSSKNIKEQLDVISNENMELQIELKRHKAEILSLESQLSQFKK